MGRRGRKRRRQRSWENQAPAVESRPPVPTSFRITEEVLQAIRETIGSRPAENGGALGGDPEDGVVRHFHFDEGSARTRATYSPEVGQLNRLFKEDWNPRGIRLMGFVHSHPGGFGRPSMGDEVYATDILGAVEDMGYLMLPIVMTEPDTGRFELRPHVAVPARRGVEIRPLELEVVSEDAVASTEPTEAVESEGLDLDPTALAAHLESIRLRNRILANDLWLCGPDQGLARLRQEAALCASDPVETPETTPDEEPCHESLFLSFVDRRLPPAVPPPFHWGPFHPRQTPDSARDDA